jgi:hypothetical protein
VIAVAMRHFFLRAEMGTNAGRNKEEVDEDYKQLPSPQRWLRRIGMRNCRQ